MRSQGGETDSGVGTRCVCLLLGEGTRALVFESCQPLPLPAAAFYKTVLHTLEKACCC